MKIWLAVGLALLMAAPASALTAHGDLQSRCAGYHYQALPGSKPFLLMYNDGTPLKWFAEHPERAAALGMDGWLIGGIMSDQTSDVWAADGDPRSVGDADATLQIAQRANAACRRVGITHNFLEINFTGELPDWWDDLAWSKINDNFRQAARFARAAGFAGMCIDSEYVGDQYRYQWPGYTYDHYTAADLRRMARTRMSQMAGAMYDEFPQMEFFLVHSADQPIAFELAAGWIEEAARRNAPGGIHIATEGSYDACSAAFILAQVVAHSRRIEEHLGPRARTYWRKRCGMSPGGWPLRMDSNFDGKTFKRATLDVAQFRAQMAGLNMASRKYTWIFSAGPSWWQASAEEVKQYNLPASVALPAVPHLEEYYRIAATAEAVADPAMLRASRALRTMNIDDADALIAPLGLRAIWIMLQPFNQLSRDLVPATDHRWDWTSAQLGRLAADDDLGRRPDVTPIFDFARDFSVIGPFSNERWQGHNRVYPPEEPIDLGATCQGMAGPVTWQKTTVPEGQGYLDFVEIMKPKDWTVAYALVYVHSPRRQRAQIRTGSNDAIKLWFNGRLMYQHQSPGGRWAVVDDDIVPVTLPAGESVILAKVAQTTGRWGLYLRLTDEAGRPLENVTMTPRP